MVKIFVNDLNSMVKIPLSDNFIDQQIVFPHNVFWGFHIFIMTHPFLNIFFLVVYPFFSSSFSFPLFSLFLFFFLSSFFPPHFPFLSLFSSFFLFPNLHHFLNLVCRFLRVPPPMLPHFLLPCTCCRSHGSNWTSTLQMSHILNVQPILQLDLGM